MTLVFGLGRKKCCPDWVFEEIFLATYADFSENVWAQIESTVQEVKKQDPIPYAAFDADGTLWDTDLGENFFKYKIRNKLVPFEMEDPWRHYRDWKEGGDPRPAYLWLAQVCKGFPLAEVQAWAEAAVQEFKSLPIFPAQKKLIDYLLKNGVQVFIVTASIKWAVEPGARRLGLAAQEVLGVETAIVNGLVTAEAAGHMTYRQGKAEAILQRMAGKKPFLASGNTKGDLALMESATHLRLAVTASHPGEEMFPSEDELQREAQQRGWITHRFR